MARTKMSEDHFVVSYEGPALDNHEMSARDLANSILALSEVFHRAQEIASPLQTPVQLSVQAFNPGSFEVAMLLSETQSFLNSVVNLFDSSPVNAALNASALSAFVWGAFCTIKAFAGRKVVKKTQDNSSGLVTLELEDGTTVSLPSEQYILITDLEFRKKVRDVVKPVDGRGITSLSVKGIAEPLKIESSDVPHMGVPNSVKEEELSNDVTKEFLQPLGIEFDRKKWRFSNGTSTFTAEIKDEQFAKDVEEHNIPFTKGDLLVVNLRTRRYKDKNGDLKAEHFVEEVLEHRRSGVQLTLGLEEE